MLLFIHPDNPQERHIDSIVKALEKGGIIIFPTDTVYALGCSLLNRKAVSKIALLNNLLGVSLKNNILLIIRIALSHFFLLTNELFCCLSCFNWVSSFFVFFTTIYRVLILSIAAILIYYLLILWVQLFNPAFAPYDILPVATILGLATALIIFPLRNLMAYIVDKVIIPKRHPYQATIR